MTNYPSGREEPTLERQAIAHHIAGHAVAALSYRMPTESISALPTDDDPDWRHDPFYGCARERHPGRIDAERLAVVCLVGPLATRKIDRETYERSNPGQEREQAIQLLRSAYGPREAMRRLVHVERRAEALVNNEHTWGIVHDLARLLLERGQIPTTEVRNIIEAAGGLRPPTMRRFDEFSFARAAMDRLQESEAFRAFVEDAIWDRINVMVARYKKLFIALVGGYSLFLLVVLSYFGIEGWQLSSKTREMRGQLDATKLEWDAAVGAAQQEVSKAKGLLDSLKLVGDSQSTLLKERRIMLDDEKQYLNERTSGIKFRVDDLAAKTAGLQSSQLDVERAQTAYIATKTRLDTLDREYEGALAQLKQQAASISDDVNGKVEASLQEVHSQVESLKNARRPYMYSVAGRSVSENAQTDMQFGDNISLKLLRRRERMILQVYINGLNPREIEAPEAGKAYAINGTRYVVDVVRFEESRPEHRWRLDFVLGVQ